MMRIWISILLLALASACSSGQAQEVKSAEAMLPHCMAGLDPGAQDAIGGRCLGILATLSFVSRVLPDELKFCHPAEATPDQMLQVVNAFLQANPDAARQDFRLVALAAMRGHWPCED
jgi:hypothetical protein